MVPKRANDVISAATETKALIMAAPLSCKLCHFVLVLFFVQGRQEAEIDRGQHRVNAPVVIAALCRPRGLYGIWTMSPSRMVTRRSMRDAISMLCVAISAAKREARTMATNVWNTWPEV